MPFLNLKIVPEQSPARQAELARALTDITARELPASDWGYAGQTQLARQAARPREAAEAVA